jgi:hypothetical protein
MEPQDVEQILQTLVQITVHQDTINADIRDTLRHLAVTQARIETLLAQMLRQDGNGTDA